MLARAITFAISVFALACVDKPPQQAGSVGEASTKFAVQTRGKLTLTSFHVSMWCPPPQPSIPSAGSPSDGELPINMRQANTCVASHVVLTFSGYSTGARVALKEIRLLDDGREIDTLLSEAPSIKTGPNMYAGWDGIVPSRSEFSVRFALAKGQGTERVLNLLPKGGGDSFSIEIDVAVDDTVQTLRSARFASP